MWGQPTMVAEKFLTPYTNMELQQPPTSIWKHKYSAASRRRKNYLLSCVSDAFSNDLAIEARAILWKDIQADQQDSSTWVQPVVWLGMYSQDPFGIIKMDRLFV